MIRQISAKAGKVWPMAEIRQKPPVLPMQEVTRPMTPLIASTPAFAGFLDPVTLAIVLGGTALATFLRCGLRDVRVAGGAVMRALSGHDRFRAEEIRAHLAVQLQKIGRDGLLRATLHHTGDAEFDAGLDALGHRRSVPAMQEAVSALRQARLDFAETATRTLMQAAELAPVFGLAGTLVSLSRLPANGVDRSAYMAAIGMAVHATLYGLILANLVLAPLGRLVERAAGGEERARARIMDWMLMELELTAGPRHGPGSHGQGSHGPGSHGQAHGQGSHGAGEGGEGGHPALPSRPHTPHSGGPAAPPPLFPALRDMPDEPAPPRPMPAPAGSSSSALLARGAARPRARIRLGDNA